MIAAAPPANDADSESRVAGSERQETGHERPDRNLEEMSP
jgi:hypothetical protein